MAIPGDSPQRHIRFQKRLAVGLLLAGVVAVFIGWYFFEAARRFYTSAAHATGRIIEVQGEHSGTRNTTTRFLVFSFADASGVVHQARSRVGYDPKGLARPYEVGDSVEVVYPTDDPESARLNEFSLWHWAILFGGGGALLTVVGCVLWRGALTWGHSVRKPA